MTDTFPPPPPPASMNSSPGKGRNCWIIGCGGCLVTLAVLVIIGIVIANKIKDSLNVEPFPPMELSLEEEERILGKLQSFNLLDENGKVPEDFEMPTRDVKLTETEVNYWIGRKDPEMAESVRLDFEPGEITAEIRAGEPGGPRFRLTGKLAVSYVNGELNLDFHSLKLGPFTVPDSFLEEMKKENNFEEGFFQDEEARNEFQSKVERIEILKDEVLFVPKTGDASAQ